MDFPQKEHGREENKASSLHFSSQNNDLELLTSVWQFLQNLNFLCFLGRRGIFSSKKILYIRCFVTPQILPISCRVIFG